MAEASVLRSEQASGSHREWEVHAAHQGRSGHSWCFYTCQTIHCSPHSCEVVKTRFFTLFWSREPQKGLRGAALAGQSKRWAPNESGCTSAHMACVGGSLWAVRGAECSASAVLRGPIRRRPYNRGEIIAMKRAEMILIRRLLSGTGQISGASVPNACQHTPLNVTCA